MFILRIILFRAKTYFFRWWIVWQRREVSYFSRGRRVRQPYFAHDWNCLPPQESHILFFVTTLRPSITTNVMQGSMQQPDYTTKIISRKKDFYALCKEVIILIRCNQKCIFCNDRNIPLVDEKRSLSNASTVIEN